MEDTHESPERIKTTQTVFRIIDTIYRKDEPNINDIASELNMAYSTVHNHVKTLESLKLLREVDGSFHVGLRFLDYGLHAKDKHVVAKIAPPYLDQLADAVSEEVWLFVEEHDSIVGIERTGNSEIGSDGWLGKHIPFHCTAGGKAIMAEYSDERIQEILTSQGLEEVTDNTITNVDEFLDHIEMIRDRGYATNDGEAVLNLRGVAKAIVVNQEIHGSVCVIGPSHRLNGKSFEEEIPEKLVQTVRDIELAMTDITDLTPYTING